MRPSRYVTVGSLAWRNPFLGTSGRALPGPSADTQTGRRVSMPELTSPQPGCQVGPATMLELMS